MLPVALLQLNEGQLEWMPKNPRQWTQDGVNKAKDSLERDPDFLDDRPLLVVPHEGAYVVYAGNMRLTAARELGVEALPCVSYEPESVEDRDTIKRRAILDNGDFGMWDWDALANEWDDLPLGDWGVPAWDVDAEVEKVAKDEERKARVPFSEVLGEEHNYIVLLFDNSVDWLQAQTIFGLEPVKSFPTVKGEDKSNAYQGVGVGRVINGAKAIGMIMEEKGNR